MKNKKITPMDLLNQEGFSGIILSKQLIKKLDIESHPWLKITMENEIASKGKKISDDMVGCMVHEEGWGFIVLDEIPKEEDN